MNLSLSWEQVFPKGAYIADVRLWYEYADNKKTDKQLGLIYVLVNRLGYDKVSVKVKSKKQIISKEEIDASATDISVVANGFSGKVYNLNGKIAVSGEAEEVTLL